MSLPQQFHCCEYCGGLYDSSNCQSRTPVFYEPNPCNDHDSSGFDQPSQFTPPQPLPHSELNRTELIEHVIEQFNMNQEQFNLNQVKVKELQAKMNRLQKMLSLRNSNHDPLVDLYDLEGSDEGDMEIDSLTEEPLDIFLIVDEDFNTTPARETDKFIKSNIDDLVPILRESEVTSNSNFECDMPVNTPLPTTDVREENFDINSPLGEHVVNFLMKNEDIADLPRHLVKQHFCYLVKHPSSTKRMSDEPLGDDLKLRSYDVNFSNSLFDFNDDFTLCNDNLLFYKEFEDISILDPPKSAPLNYEPLGNPDSVSRSLGTSDLNLEELTAKIGLDDSIPTEIDDGYYDSEGDILFLEHLLIEEKFFDPTPEVLLKNSTLLVTPLLYFEHIFLREMEIFDPFFSLTQSGEKTRVIEIHSFGFNHMPSSRPAAYSP
ncbi:hypothetical protein Tco_0469253 [Tanacetum coccineum]